jgi:hypothetical protein
MYKWLLTYVIATYLHKQFLAYVKFMESTNAEHAKDNT